MHGGDAMFFACDGVERSAGAWRAGIAWDGRNPVYLKAMRWAVVIAGLFLCGAAFAANAQERRGGVYGYDLRGDAVVRLAPASARAVVLFFVATDCPISNRYAPEIQRLEKEFSGRGVVFWLVYPNATETRDGVTRHQANFGLASSTLVRPTELLLSLARATVTPESAVLTGDAVRGKEGLRAVYLGRIDNRYLDIGRERPAATRHDLEDAIEAALDKKPVRAADGPAVGCGIVSEAALRSGAEKR
jgi:thiol-disulfide isomerase/thioredoxin